MCTLSVSEHRARARVRAKVATDYDDGALVMGIRPERYEPRGFGGRNRFWLRGRCVTGPDYRGTVLTLLLILFISLLSAAISFRTLIEHNLPVGIALLSVMLVATAISIWSCWLAATTDPGIIPRSTAPPPPSRRDRTIQLNGRTILVKFCETCRIWRPPRASHCATCNNCVQRFDHHCPWLGNDIGIRNYRSYFTFVSSSAVGTLVMMVAAVWSIIIKVQFHSGGGPTTGVALRKAFTDGATAVNLLVILLALLAFAFTGGLTGFHIYLMCNNVTTAESFKKAQRNSAHNHDDLRGCAAILYLQCTRRPTSAISQGYNDAPYPDFESIQRLIAEQIEDERLGRIAQGGPTHVTQTSDADSDEVEDAEAVGNRQEMAGPSAIP